jgi:hypothetical protein
MLLAHRPAGQEDLVGDRRAAVRVKVGADRLDTEAVAKQA